MYFLETRKIFSMKRILIAIVCALSATVVHAQQDAHYSLYMFNGLFLNPAYSGSHEAIDLVGIYRHQWAGIDGAPRTGNVSINAPLRRNQYALGLVLLGDRIGLSTSWTATASFAYRIPIKRKVKIALGISASATYYQQRNTDAIPQELQAQGYYDQNYSTNTNLFVPNVGAGIYIYAKKWYVGLSAPHLIPMSINKKFSVNASEGVARQYNHYLLTAGVVIGKEKSVVKFRPSVMVKYVKGLHKNIPDFDVSAGLLFADRFWLGGTYRLAAGLDNKKGTAAIAWMQVMITHQLKIGYGFEYALSGLNKYATVGTHDIMIGYEFNNKKKRYVSPRFVSYF